MKSVQATVQRWTTNAGGAQQAYTDGIQSTQVDVMQRAIAAAPAAVANYNQALTSGRWAAAINASGGTSNWKAQTVKKASNYSTGVSQGSDKFAQAMGKLLPFIESQVNSLPARQPGNVGANLQRVAQLATALHNAKGQFKG